MSDNLQRRVLRNARARGVKVRTRHQWGSQFPKTYKTRLSTRRVAVVKADTLVSHITVTFDTGPLTGDFDRDMRTVERIGMDRFKSGFSYNFGIDPRTGMVGVGMPLMARGTHTINDKGVPGFRENQNDAARAIAWVGMPGMKPSDDAKEAFAQLFAAMMDEGALTQDPDFLPHSFFSDKDCPTQAGRDVMPWIRMRAMRVKQRR